eukprot:gene730-12_t
MVRMLASRAVADYCLDWEPSIHSGEVLKADIEHLFPSVPQKVNSLPDISNFADADEALYILRASGVIKQHYYLDEELQEAQLFASIDDLKSHLHAGISRMAKKKASVVIYTSQSISFVIHTGREENDMYLALLDSHYIPDTLRGCNACSIVLLRYLEMQEKTVIMKLVDWMVKRVNNGAGFHSLFELVSKDEDVQQSIINDSETKHAEWDEDISYMTEGLEIPEEGWAEDLSYMAHELAEAVPSAHDNRVMLLHSLEDNNCTPTCTNGLVWHGILTKFGLTTFKPFQIQALWAIDHGRDAIVVQPTGSGKSLCFQVAALAYDKNCHCNLSTNRTDRKSGDEEPQNNTRVLGDRHDNRPLLAYMTQEHFNKVCQDLHRDAALHQNVGVRRSTQDL